MSNATKLWLPRAQLSRRRQREVMGVGRVAGRPRPAAARLGRHTAEQVTLSPQVPAGYIAAEFFVLTYWTMRAAFDLAADRWWHGAFGLVNIALLAYAVAFFIGLRHAGADLAAPPRATASN